MVHHRAFSLKNLGYWWEHRQTTERFHSSLGYGWEHRHTTECFHSKSLGYGWEHTHTTERFHSSLGYGWEHRQTTERFHSRVLVMDGSTDRPQCFPSRIWDTDVSTDNSVFSLKNYGFTCPHRPQNVFTQEPQINPLGPRPPVTAHSFSLPRNPRPPGSGQLADAPYYLLASQLMQIGTGVSRDL